MYSAFCQFLALVVLLAFAPAAVDKEAAIEKEMKSLQGTWQLESAVKDGQEAPAEATQKIRVVIQSGKHSVYFGDDVVAKDVQFAIDPTRDPKETTDTLADGRKISGIYKLEGDKLTSCVGGVDGERPREFSAPPGSGRTLRTFRRVKP